MSKKRSYSLTAAAVSDTDNSNINSEAKKSISDFDKMVYEVCSKIPKGAIDI